MSETRSETRPVTSQSTIHALRAPSVVGRSIGVALRSVSRCRVCGFSEIRTDEVVDRGAVLLAECPRCEHRWTEPTPGPFVVRPRARRSGEAAEVVSAA